ncbi:MAG: hypothetical protein K8R45_09795, partial [Desulfobacterales bacterium]|nr:hypothetical protein [Desulfobacterales bacterium]
MKIKKLTVLTILMTAFAIVCLSGQAAFAVPSLSGGGTLNYQENDPATVIDNTITVTGDGDPITSAAIQITINYVNGEDLLTCGTPGGLIVSWASGSGKLNLSGSALPSVYQTALQSVRYENTSDNPSTLPRTVAYVVNDGADSNTIQSTVNVTSVNDEPSFTKGANETILEDAGAQTVAAWATAISAGP